MSEPTTAKPHAEDIDVAAIMAEVTAFQAKIADWKTKLETYQEAVEQVFQDAEPESELEDTANVEQGNANDIIEELENTDSALGELVYDLGPKYCAGNFFSAYEQEISELYDGENEPPEA